MTLEFVLIMHVVTLSARNLRSPRMTASYSAMLLVHLSDSKAKLRCAAYLYLMPACNVMIAAAPAPAWHHVCWGPSASEGPQKHDLTMFLEYNT
jgi:hypothetical protein